MKIIDDAVKDQTKITIKDAAKVFYFFSCVHVCVFGWGEQTNIMALRNTTQPSLYHCEKERNYLQTN